MTAIKLLLFPLTIAVALLWPRYELWCFAEYWSDTFEDAFSYLATSFIAESWVAPTDCLCSPCRVGAPRQDDDSHD